MDMLEEMQSYNRVHQHLADERQAEAGSVAPKVRQIGMNDEMQALQRQLSEPNPNPALNVGAGDILASNGVVSRVPTLEEIQKEREAERAAKANRNRILDVPPVDTEKPTQKMSAVSSEAMEESRRVREAAERKRRLNGGDSPLFNGFQPCHANGTNNIRSGKHDGKVTDTQAPMDRIRADEHR
jgi:hypothetical protein